MEENGTIKMKATLSIANRPEVVFIPDEGAAWVRIQTRDGYVLTDGLAVSKDELQRAVEWLEKNDEWDGIPFGHYGELRRLWGNIYLSLFLGVQLVDTVAINPQTLASTLCDVIDAIGEC